MQAIRSARRHAAAALAAATCFGAARSARAQDVAPPIEEGSTDQTRLAAQLGGSWSTGNSKSFATNVQARLSHRRGDDQITWSGVLNYARATAQPAGTEPDGPEHTYKSDSLYYTRLRYDRFFLEKNSVFVAAAFFRDTSSGFSARYSPYAGYQRTLIATDSFELWVEGGVRFSREVLMLDAAARRAGLPERRDVYGPLVGVGFELKLNDTLDFDVGVEAQHSLNVPGDTRVFGVAQLVNRIGRGFAIGTNFNLRWLRAPIGDREPLDTQLQVIALLEHTIEPKK